MIVGFMSELLQVVDRHLAYPVQRVKKVEALLACRFVPWLSITYG